ncbi:ABC transporter permease [Desulfohalovibrio reitneri]|uniref:ABC transporter permease n=1 Tax=Desulfohalovibrio reitneri TaxID=1307759 RepID=UPI0009DFC6EA|nr:proline/glycine betaine ABC transporter permease [Desulfohalovibrio reitneri]
MIVSIPVGDVFARGIEWMNTTLAPFFSAVSTAVNFVISISEGLLLAPPSYLMIPFLAALAWRVSGRGVGIFTLLGMFLVDGMGMWDDAMRTLALVLASAAFALLVGIPVGIWAARNDRVEQAVRPVLDFMQTMPAFVYLIPAVLFFQLGKVPGAMATVIFAMPPSVRLTNLGIRQVSEEVVEATRAFGGNDRQLLFKVQLPLALTTILAGVNQTIMLALSMVVIAAMIGAGGLGQQVLKGIEQLRIGLGFESGLAVVILAMFLDRVTQGLGRK